MFIGIVRMTEAFTIHLSTQTGPEVFLSDVSEPVSLLGNTIYCIQTLIGDAVVVSCVSFLHRVVLFMVSRYIAAMFFGVVSIL